jgi:hypothetical protein
MSGRCRYIAVSWRWSTAEDTPLPDPDGYPATTSFDYYIERRGCIPHKSDFPDHYLERVIRFARAQHIETFNIWIDKESIYQREGDDAKDLELGVQIMDVVYGHSTHSVGLLSTALMYQEEIDLLGALLSTSLFVEPIDERSPELKRNIDPSDVADLILHIIRDPRFDRGWIFQEDHLASKKMVLLIPHPVHLKKAWHSHFGTIPGELQVDLARFRQVVTLFCMSVGDDYWSTSEIIGKVKQYNLWNRRVYDSICSDSDSSESSGQSSSTSNSTIFWDSDDSLTSSNVSIADTSVASYDSSMPSDESNATSSVALYPSSTSSILEDICSRNLFKEEDRVAILANAAKYPVRLNITSKSYLVTSPEYSLSTALLALIFLNGEILTSSMSKDPRSILDHTLQSYLGEYQCRFEAPTLRFEQTFINHCRLKPPEITKSWMETKGWLFEFHSRYDECNLHLTDEEIESLEPLRQSKEANQTWGNQRLSAFAREIIKILVTKLDEIPGCELGDYLDQNLKLDIDPTSGDWTPFTPYVLDNMAAIAQALEENRDVHLAELPGKGSNPSAIFISPLHWQGSDTDPDEVEDSFQGPGVFTSWDNGRKWSTITKMESLASLEVNFSGRVRRKKGNRDSIESLQMLGWINGVWDPHGSKMRTYRFPLPGITG